MTVTESMPTCRRKAIRFGVFGVLALALAWLIHASGLPISDWMLGMITGFGAGGVLAAAILWWMPDNSDAVPKRLAERYRREMLLPMGGYVLAVLVWKRTLHLFDATWLRVLLALLPALFVLGVLRAFVRYVRDSDELQRRIELEAGAVSGLLLSAAYLAAGFLQSAGLIAIPATVAMLWVFPMLCFGYGITKVVIARRYL